jgi:hypothetical protein
MTPSEALYCIDMGTTNCRVFVTQGHRIWARVEAGFGVRDRGKSPAHLREKLEVLIAEASEKARAAGLTTMPGCALRACRGRRHRSPYAVLVYQACRAD